MVVAEMFRVAVSVTIAGHPAKVGGRRFLLTSGIRAATDAVTARLMGLATHGFPSCCAVVEFRKTYIFLQSFVAAGTRSSIGAEFTPTTCGVTAPCFLDVDTSSVIVTLLGFGTSLYATRDGIWQAVTAVVACSSGLTFIEKPAERIPLGIIPATFTIYSIESIITSTRL